MNSPRLLLQVALFALGVSAHSAEPSRHPNFLFIYTDDQRWDAMGVVQREQGGRGRFPWFETPHMDRLAVEGVRFRNAFVTTALCAPSRAALLTGRYNHLNGVANNRTPFPEQSVTWATELRKAGYTTGYIGKWHMGGQRGPRPGFDYSASFIGQGRYFDCPIEVNGTSTPSKGWVDDVSTGYAIDFIKSNQEKPWSLAIGFKACHGPFDPPERAKERFAGVVARPVPNLTIPAIYNLPSEAAPARPADQTSPAGSRPPRPLNLGYFRCISGVDDNLGKLLAILDELGLAANTVVIFTSDNGFYLGEHMLADKRTAYEESMRIPMLVRYPQPGTKGTTVDQIALNIDVAPTLLDIAGVAVPKEMQGRSLRPLLEGKAPDSWRTAFFYEYFREGGFGAPTVFAVRTESAKLIKYPGNEAWTEVFDLKNDPYETRNLANDAAHKELRATLEAEYDRQTKAVEFRVPDYVDKPEPPGRQAQGVRGVVLEYRFDKDAGAKVMDASGKNNHGTAKDAPLVEGRDGAKARKFGGQSHLEVPKSASLNPAAENWTVEITFKAAARDGVLIAHGGATSGYCLAIEAGKPLFAVNGRGQASRVVAAMPVGNDWTNVRASITPQTIALSVNGGPAVSESLRGPIGREPRDTLQIGADLGSNVLANKKLPAFTGLIESVRIVHGTP